MRQRTNRTKHTQSAGQVVLNSAAVLHSKNKARAKLNVCPVNMAVFNSEAMTPRSLGSVISLTYGWVRLVLNPTLKPISRLEAYSAFGDCAKYSSVQPAMLGAFEMIMQRFFPYLTCIVPAMKHPIG